MKKSFSTIIIAALAILILVTGCDFAEPKATEKPKIQFYSVALDYVGLGVGELAATLNDQDALSQQMLYLAQQGGYEYESYEFKQNGEIDIYYPSKVTININDAGQIESIEVPTVDNDPLSRTATNVVLSQNCNAVDAENVENIQYPVTCSIPWKTEFSLKFSAGYNISSEVKPFWDKFGPISRNDIERMKISGPGTFDGEPLTEDEWMYAEDFYNEVIAIYQQYLAVNGSEDLSDYINFYGKDDGVNVSVDATKYLHDDYGFSRLVTDTARAHAGTFKNGDAMTSNDIVFFQYSGHGAANAGNGLNGEFALGARDRLDPMSLRSIFASTSAKKVMFIDSCFSGGVLDFFNLYDPPLTFSDSMDAMLSVRVPYEMNTWILTASRNYETSADGGEGNLSLFTGQLVKALGGVVKDPNNDSDGTMKSVGFVSFDKPGLPDSDSIWFSVLLSEVRSNVNILQLGYLQYPMGDYYSDLRLFTGLDK